MYRLKQIIIIINTGKPSHYKFISDRELRTFLCSLIFVDNLILVKGNGYQSNLQCTLD